MSKPSKRPRSPQITSINPSKILKAGPASSNDVKRLVKNQNGLLLQTAVEANDTDAIAQLLDNGVDVNTLGKMYTPLCLAIRRNNETLIKNLLQEHKADMSILSRKKESALLLAVKHGSEATLRLLLQSNAQVDSLVLGRTVLYHAVKMQHDQHVKLLLEYKANPNFSSPAHHTTPLHLSVFNGCESSVKLLLDYNAHVNQQTSAGDTPLHVAAFQDNARMVETLLHYGRADPTIVNLLGVQAVHMCEMNTAAAFTLEQATKLDNQASPLCLALLGADLTHIRRLVEQERRLGQLSIRGRELLQFSASQRHLLLLLVEQVERAYVHKSLACHLPDVLVETIASYTLSDWQDIEETLVVQ